MGRSVEKEHRGCGLGHSQGTARCTPVLLNGHACRGPLALMGVRVTREETV